MQVLKRKDIFEEKLEEKTQDLKKCQDEKNVQSCLSCQQILDCSTRDTYVQAVYNSMSKGKAGDFSF